MQYTSRDVAAFKRKVKNQLVVHKKLQQVSKTCWLQTTSKPQFLPSPALGIRFLQRLARSFLIHVLVVEEKIGVISFVPSPVGFVEAHSIIAMMRPLQAMRSWLQLPWTFEGLWGTVALFSRNAAARFQPAFILQSSVSGIEVLHNRILYNGLDKSGAVHRKSPCEGTGSGALTRIFTLQQMEGYLEVEHWWWRYCQDLHPGAVGKGTANRKVMLLRNSQIIPTPFQQKEQMISDLGKILLLWGLRT